MRYREISVPNPMPPALVVCVASCSLPLLLSVVVPMRKFPDVAIVAFVLLLVVKLTGVFTILPTYDVTVSKYT